MLLHQKKFNLNILVFFLLIKKNHYFIFFKEKSKSIQSQFDQKFKEL